MYRPAVVVSRAREEPAAVRLAEKPAEVEAVDMAGESRWTEVPAVACPAGVGEEELGAGPGWPGTFLQALVARPQPGKGRRFLLRRPGI